MDDVRVRGCPVTADVLVVVRDSASLLNSDAVFAVWSLTLSATGPGVAHQILSKSGVCRLETAVTILAKDNWS